MADAWQHPSAISLSKDYMHDKPSCVQTYSLQPTKIYSTKYSSDLISLLEMCIRVARNILAGTVSGTQIESFE